MSERQVTLDRSEYDALLARIADLEDALELAKCRVEDDGVRVPHAVVRAEADGAHPVRAWRRHRGLSARALAQSAGLAPTYLSEIETRRKAGSLAAYRALSAALDVPLDLLVGDND